jgi:hypothetical protein
MPHPGMPELRKELLLELRPQAWDIRSEGSLPSMRSNDEAIGESAVLFIIGIIQGRSWGPED